MLKQGNILIVDDERFYLNILVDLLQQDYQLHVANDGKQALKIVAEILPDLILLDIVMPEMDGYEVCSQIKRHPEWRGIPVIFLTANTDLDAEIKAFDFGAVDYITKPVSAPTVKARVKTHMALKQALAAVENQNRYLEDIVAARTREIQLTQDAAIFSMASITETRDNETGAHLFRTQRYLKLLAVQLKSHPKFSDFLDDETIDLLFKSAPLHDIGKIGVPDRILKKPGKLTTEEFSEMQKHTTYGGDAIRRAERELGSTSFLRYAREIAYSHQEKWDGSGYPEGLKGEQIPISARLMAVSDVYDALISKRVYKPPMKHEQAVDYIANQKGCHFDPEIVDVFLRIESDFKRIASEYRDN
ncbi:MAG: two-component system response regulator [Methylococcales bacterium]